MKFSKVYFGLNWKAGGGGTEATRSCAPEEVGRGRSTSLAAELGGGALLGDELGPSFRGGQIGELSSGFTVQPTSRGRPKRSSSCSSSVGRK